jgi:hypothetical protein
VPHPTPLRGWLPVVALWLAACTSPADAGTSSSVPAQADALPVVAPEPAVPDPPVPDPSRAWVDPPRTHLLLLRHTDDAPELDVLPLALPAAGTPTLLPSHRLPALPRADWPGHYVAIATHGGQAAWAHAGGREGAWTLVRRDADSATPAPAIPIGATIPAAMHMAGDVVMIGAGNTIGTVDLAADPPRWQALHRRPDMQFKAYDLFARAGEWLVAIDDEVMPMYADTFTLDATGHATHRAAWELPGVINGHYGAAVLGRTGPADGTLWVVASYGIMDGHGQDLAALAIQGDALQTKPDVILNSHPLDDPPVLEEHVSRHTGKPEKLALGTDFTPWTGLARFAPASGPARLLLAAGPRGLLLVPERFGPTTRAEGIDVGGECADVWVDGERVLVLVAGPAPAVLELRPTATGLAPGLRLPLPVTYHRFVR